VYVRAHEFVPTTAVGLVVLARTVGVVKSP
jgi:hypothetical protein